MALTHNKIDGGKVRLTVVPDDQVKAMKNEFCNK